MKIKSLINLSILFVIVGMPAYSIVLAQTNVGKTSDLANKVTSTSSKNTNSPITFAQVIPYSTPAESSRIPFTLQEFINKSGLTPGEGAKIDPTIVSGIYAFHYPHQNGRCAQFVTGDLELIANQGGKGWHHLKSGNTLSSTEEQQLGRRILAALPGHVINIGPKEKQPAISLISAVDCPYCSVLEAKLVEKKISYQVLPGAIDQLNEPIAETAWLSSDPEAAWKKAVSGIQIKQTINKASAPYPGSDIKDVRCMFGGGTPIAIFPSGKIVNGSQYILQELGL